MEAVGSGKVNFRQKKKYGELTVQTGSLPTDPAGDI